MLRFRRIDLPAGFASSLDVFTNTAGAYRAQGLSPAVYDVYVLASDHATHLTTLDLTSAGGSPEGSSNGEGTGSDVPFSPALVMGTVVSGQVTDATSGSPLSGVSLTVFRQSDNRVLGRYASQADGNYVLNGLTPGQPVSILVDDGTRQQRMLDLTPPAAGSVADTNLSASTTQINGTVGGGLAGVQIVAIDSAGRTRGTTVSKPDGSFGMSNLPPEPFVLTAKGGGLVTSTPVPVTPSPGTPSVVTVSVDPSATTGGPSPLPSPPPPPPPSNADRDLKPPVEQYIPPPLPAPREGCEVLRNETADYARLIWQLWQGVEMARSGNSNWVIAGDVTSGLLQLGLIANDILGLKGPLADAKNSAEGAIDNFHSNVFMTALNPYYKEALAKIRTDAFKLMSTDLPDQIKTVYGLITGATEAASPLEIAQYIRDGLKQVATLIGQIKLLFGPLESLKTLMEWAGPLGKVFSIISIAENTINLGLDIVDAVISAKGRASAQDNAEFIYRRAISKYGQIRARYDECNLRNQDRPIKPPGIKPPGTTPSGGQGQNHVQGVDPNDKIGPAAFAAQGHMVPRTMLFDVTFENDPQAGATAPAQEVSISDTFDDDLDLSTLEFQAFGFQNMSFPVPAGLRHYTTTLDLRSQGIHLLVPVTLDVNTQTRVLTATFGSLDPVTGLLPDDVDAGFLPVNDKQLHNGEGFIRYSVRPKEGLSSGTVITNLASIIFDINAPILTPTTTHTLDIGPPTSQVQNLSSQSAPNFTVHWSGSDDAGGSGIATYDVYASIDSGPFTIWLDDSAAMSATLTVKWVTATPSIPWPPITWVMSNRRRPAPTRRRR